MGFGIEGAPRQGGMVLAPSGSAPAIQQNPIEQIQERIKGVEASFRTWLARQPMAIEAAVSTATGAIQGAAIGGLMGTLTPPDAMQTPAIMNPGLNPQAMASLQQSQAFAGGPMVQARNFAVMTGVNAGISSIMKRIRGVEDVQSSMVAAFGSGAMFSLVSGMGTPNLAVNMVTTGLFFSLFQGGIFMVGQKFSQPQTEDLYYARARSMLLNLGLQKYEKNFKKGLLTDETLPLLNDSALRDVKIPPGPRLLILDHIQRDPELTKER